MIKNASKRLDLIKIIHNSILTCDIDQFRIYIDKCASDELSAPIGKNSATLLTEAADMFYRCGANEYIKAHDIETKEKYRLMCRCLIDREVNLDNSLKAAVHSDLKLCQMLLEAGASIDNDKTINVLGHMIFFYRRNEETLKIYQLLIDTGASLDSHVGLYIIDSTTQRYKLSRISQYIWGKFTDIHEDIRDLLTQVYIKQSNISDEELQLFAPQAQEMRQSIMICSFRDIYEPTRYSLIGYDDHQYKFEKDIDENTLLQIKTHNLATYNDIRERYRSELKTCLIHALIHKDFIFADYLTTKFDADLPIQEEKMIKSAIKI